MSHSKAIDSKDNDVHRTSNDNQLDAEVYATSVASIVQTRIPASVAALTPEERVRYEKKLVRKIDLVLMPLLVLFYILNYLDRQNIASARLANLEHDLGLEGTEYQTCVSILFVGYIIMQVPSNLILGRIKRPAWYMCGCMGAWGALSALTGTTQNFSGLVACRFFLGFLEAAFFPGAMFYLSCWYTKRELGLRTAILYCGSQVGSAFGGLVAIGILQLDGLHGIEGWRWLFLIEGIVTVGFAILSAFILPDFPATYSGLTPQERDLAVWRLEEDAGEGDDNQETSRVKGFVMALTDPKTWMLLSTLFFIYVAAAVTNFFPSVVKTLGYSRNVTLLLTAPPYLLCCVTMMLNGLHADKTRERFLHVAGPLLITIAANILAVTTTATAPRYVAMMLMPASFYAASIVVLTWISQSLNRPPVKRAAGIAFINALANTPNIWTSYLYINPPRYLIAFTVNVVAAALAIISAFILRVYLTRQNTYIGRGQFERLGKSGPSSKQIDLGFRYLL